MVEARRGNILIARNLADKRWIYIGEKQTVGEFNRRVPLSRRNKRIRIGGKKQFGPTTKIPVSFARYTRSRGDHLHHFSPLSLLFFPTLSLHAVGTRELAGYTVSREINWKLQFHLRFNPRYEWTWNDIDHPVDRSMERTTFDSFFSYFLSPRWRDERGKEGERVSSRVPV